MNSMVNVVSAMAEKMDMLFKMQSSLPDPTKPLPKGKSRTSILGTLAHAVNHPGAVGAGVGLGAGETKKPLTTMVPSGAFSVSESGGSDGDSSDDEHEVKGGTGLGSTGGGLGSTGTAGLGSTGFGVGVGGGLGSTGTGDTDRHAPETFQLVKEFGNFTNWSRFIPWRSGRTRHEVISICAALDAFIKEGVPPTSEGIEIMVRRLNGLTEVDQGGYSWSVCKAMQYHRTNASITPRALLKSAIKDASLAEKMEAPASSSSSKKPKGISKKSSGGGGGGSGSYSSSSSFTDVKRSGSVGGHFVKPSKAGTTTPGK